MQLPVSDKLDIQNLSRIFDNKSECYKLFWFQSVVNKVATGMEEITYDEIINDMVADAWYMVCEYRLNLGPKDTLEALVHYTKEISGMKSTEKKETIIRFLEKTDDKKIKRMKRILTNNVPYRIQAPFMENMRGTEWNVSAKKLIERINQEKRLMYYYSELLGMESVISITKGWSGYIKENAEIINGWIEYNLIIYLQRRNPSVPGIPNKIFPPVERKLEKVKKFWKEAIEIRPFVDIYSGRVLTEKDLSIDHFVPWSYVAHDEMWNLHPTIRSANSSKSNNLPDWNKYFPELCKTEYESYKMIWQYDGLRRTFEKCTEVHVNSDDVRRRLYRKSIGEEEFCNVLEEIISPVYQSAKNIGFRNWVYADEQ